MGRRKKEPESVHRENISAAAERLFREKGIEAATMDDIAREAGYSKATLYVYFENKEELIGFLVLKSMKLLYGCLHEAVEQGTTVRETYDRICCALTRYQENYPLYFAFALGEIQVSADAQEERSVERETYETGELINVEIARFIRGGIKEGEFQPDIPILPTTFLFWAALAGVIQMAGNKQGYMEQSLDLSKQQFLEFGFDRLYRMIAVEGRS